MDEFDDFVSSPQQFNADDAMNDFLKREKEALPQEDFLQDDAPKSAPTTNQAKAPSPVFTTSSLPVSVQPTSKPQQEESDAVRQWKLRQEEQVKEKDAASKKRHEATITKARKEIDAFYEEYNAKKAKAIARNKEQEAALMKQRDDGKGVGGSVWERVANQIDMNASVGGGGSIKKDKAKDGKKETAPEKEVKRDTSRFKSMLLQLKNDPKAPGNEVTA